MRSLMLTVMCFVAAASASTAPRAQQRPAGAQAELRAAIDREAVDGDLAAAIKAYQAILDRYSASDRVTAATALMRMAEAYRRLGDAQARRAYERVLRDFGDVGEVVAAARSRLAHLNAAERAAVPAALTMRRVYDGPGLDWCNGLSSDLRYLSHPDWATGNIAVADLRTGAVRHVTTTGSIGPVTAQIGEFGECTIFSPDDRQIAYYWKAKATTELRITGTDGSNTRSIYSGGAENPYLRPLDWSRDGRTILVELSRKQTTELAAISVGNGAARVVTSLAASAGNIDGQFSPDGRYIAYARREAADSTKRDVFLIASDGSGDTAIVRHPADDRLLGWAPDGGMLFFASDRTGSNGVWSLGIAHGKATGAPILVKADVGAITPVRFVNGSLYYALGSQVSDVYVADVDPASGRAIGIPTPAKPDFSGSNAKPDWSPDGASLAYVSFRGTAGHPAAPEHIGILDLRTRVERRIRPALEQLEPFGSGPDWSPDGRALLVIARQQTPQHGLYRIDVQTGVTTAIVKAPGRFLLQGLWSRDGNSVFYTIGGGCEAEACPTRIMRRDVASGADIEIASLPNPAGVPKLTISPDGQSLAFTSRRGGQQPVALVSVVPAAGGAIRDLYRAPEGQGTGFVAWAPDGRHIYFVTQGELWRVTADGSRSERVEGSLQPGRGWFSFSPDGRRVAFTKGGSKSELWALENLAPVR